MSGKSAASHFLKKPLPPKRSMTLTVRDKKRKNIKPPPPPLPRIKPVLQATSPSSSPSTSRKNSQISKFTPKIPDRRQNPSNRNRLPTDIRKRNDSDKIPLNRRVHKISNTSQTLRPRNAAQIARGIRSASVVNKQPPPETPDPVSSHVFLEPPSTTSAFKKSQSLKSNPFQSTAIVIPDTNFKGASSSYSTQSKPKKENKSYKKSSSSSSTSDENATDSYVEREIDRLRKKSRKYANDSCSLIFGLVRNISLSRMHNHTHQKTQRKLDDLRKQFLASKSLEDKESQLCELENEIIYNKRRYETSLRNLKDEEIFSIIDILVQLKNSRISTVKSFENYRDNLSKELEDIKKLKDYLYVNSQIRSNLESLRKLNVEVIEEKQKIVDNLKPSVLHNSMFDITLELMEIQKRFEVKMKHDRQIDDLFDYEKKYFSDSKGKTRKKFFQDYVAQYKALEDHFSKHMLFFAVVSEGDGILREVCEKVPFLEVKKRFYNLQEKYKERNIINEKVHADFLSLNLKNDQRVEKVEKLNNFIRTECTELSDKIITESIKLIDEVASPQFKRIEWSKVSKNFSNFQQSVEGEFRSVIHEMKNIQKELEEMMSQTVSYYGKIYEKEEKGVMNIFRKKRKLTYFGGMKDGKADGKGKEFYEDGKTLLFFGNFLEGRRHGKGEIYDRKGEISFKGDWESGENKAEHYDNTHLLVDSRDSSSVKFSVKDLCDGVVSPNYEPIFFKVLPAHLESMKEIYLKRSIIHISSQTKDEKKIEATEINLREFKKNVLDSQEEKLRCFVGKGTFSDVYKLELKGKTYAFKHFHGVMSPTEQKQLQTELELMYNLNHPNLIKVYGVSNKEPNGIITELCKESISKIIDLCSEKKRNISFDFKMDILIQTCLGMEYLHGNRVIHRDLKWENVLIMEDNFVKIIDFGFSKTIHSFKNSVRNTVGRVGTPQYIAPEILTGKGNYRFPCDVFSFGIMLYELVFETLDPYDLANRENYFGGIEYQVANKNIRPKIKVNEFTNDKKWIVKLIKRCWSQNPKDRPTFREIIRIMLSNWLGKRV